jgi:predicted phosphodiesterase
MRIAILSDIHGNYPALQAVSAHLARWRPDVTVVNGDTVNRGPRPLECLRYVQAMEAEAGWIVLRGNHEDYVISRAEATEPPGHPLYESYRMAMWTYQQLGGDVADLRRMPDHHEVTAPDGSILRAVHASMRSNRDGIYTTTPDDQLAVQIAPAPAVFVTSHTHRPLQRRLNGTLVVNTGAVGLPFDGDRRAAYARVTWRRGEWRAEIVRLSYNHAQADRDFEASGCLEGGGPLIELVRHELATARPHLHVWAEKYLPAVESGEISMAESVRRVWEEIGGTHR